MNQPGKEKIQAQSPAKINLFLNVTGKRPDGYHNLNTLMCCITLYDTIDLDFHENKIRVTCDHPLVPEDESNLVFKAAELFFENSGKQGGVGINIKKAIPVGAGLGGGSSNAASVLLNLNHHYGSPFNAEELGKLGLAIGADVPFFIFGKPAIATGIGEKLRAYKFLKPFYVLLINPGFSVSTAEVYKNLNLGLTKCEKKFKRIPFNGVSIDILDFLCNDLESVTADMYPDINKLKLLLIDHGAEGALMSGSGPTVFGLFSDAEKIKKAYRELTEFNEKQKFLTRLITT